MLERILTAIFKGVIHLLGEIIKALWHTGSKAVARKSRDVYAFPAENQASGPPPPPSEIASAPIADERFAGTDAALAGNRYEEALQFLSGPPPLQGKIASWYLGAAHRCWLLWQQWSDALVEPQRSDTEEIDDHLTALRRRESILRDPLKTGCACIDALLATNPDYPDARLLGRKLHGVLAQSGWNFGPKDEGYEHQKRVMELTDALIDYETLDLAQRCALEGQVFGNFFDFAESQFKQGKIESDNHLYAAMVYEGAVHSERWPLSSTDRKRSPEFLTAALAHLEYCERHKQELGPHWHNVMARVLAGRGQIDDARFHFQRFKDLAATGENGEGMIAVFGKDTIQVINHCIEEHNAMVERSRRR